MTRKNPYKFWTKDELYYHLIRQAEGFGFDNSIIIEIKEAIYSNKWNCIEDFNGCNLVRDCYHPFLPCFLHDYHWQCLGGGYKYDKIFRRNLIQCEMYKWKAKLWFFGVRLGWLLYYKWRK